MIKFFRNIRKNLINEGKTSRYLKYAIGEIILVVIGILIALQINNWNENRKLDNVELNLLYEIKSNLNESSRMLEYTLEANKELVKGYKILLKHVEEKKPYKESLDTIFGRISYWNSPYFTSTAYETLKSRGSEIIQNDSLKQQIVELYEAAFVYLSKDWDQSMWVDRESIIRPYYAKHFAEELDENVNKIFAKPNDYEDILNDSDFTNILRLSITSLDSGNLACNGINEYIKNVMDAIDKELDSRNFKLSTDD